jgi:type III secretion protein J
MRYLGLVVLVLAMGCSTPVHHGLDEGAANEMVSALERAGMAASKARDEAGGEVFVVTVARGDAVRALELLRSLGLPRARRNGFGEIYKQASLVPTHTEERARYLEALAGELERTLETVEGVASARVHLVLPEPDPLATDGKPRVPAQGAVLLKVRTGPAPIREADVQRLLAGSVPGLSAEAVSVVLTSAPEGPSPSTPALESLGPLRMAPGGRVILLAALGIALLLLAGLAAVLLVTARRLARKERGESGEANELGLRRSA